MILEQIEGLIMATKNEKDDLDMVHSSVSTVVSYIKAVSRMEREIPFIRAKAFSQKELVEGIEKLDRDRRIAHNAAISSVKILNRLCTMYSLPEIYLGSVEDRQEVASFAKELHDAYVIKGLSRGLSK